MTMDSELVAVNLAKHEQRILVTEKGVANFRDFTAEVREFITRADTRDEERERFQNKRDQEIKEALDRRDKRINSWLAVASTLILALTLLVAWLTWRDSRRAAIDANPAVSSTQRVPQEAGTRGMP